MRTRLLVCLSLLGLMQVAAFPLSREKREAQNHLSAPTYYIAARVRDYGAGWAEIVGVTNLPSGSMVTITVADFYQVWVERLQRRVLNRCQSRRVFSRACESEEGVVVSAEPRGDRRLHALSARPTPRGAEGRR